MGLKVEYLENGLISIRAEAPKPLSFKNNTSKGILNYGSDNLYPQNIIDIINKSSYGSSCQKTFANYIFGEGLDVQGTSVFAEYVKRVLLPADKTLKIVTDYSMFGGFSLQLIPTMNAEIQSVSHVDFSIVRLGDYDPAKFEVVDAKISADWSKSTKAEYKPFTIELYDKLRLRGKIDEFKKNGIPDDYAGQLLYVKQYKPGEPFYPTPAWASALNWLYIDGQISVFQSKNLDNGFFPSTIIFHPGKFEGKVPDGREKKDAIKQDLENFTSAENAGKIFNTFGSSLTDAPQVIQFTANTNSELFNTLGDITDKKIVAGFQMPKILAGIETTGSLGATNEIANAIELYYSIIQPHIVFIEDELNKVLQNCRGYDGTKVKFKKAKPISYLDPKFLNYLTDEEIRVAAGFPAQKPVIGGTP